MPVNMPESHALHQHKHGREEDKVGKSIFFMILNRFRLRKRARKRTGQEMYVSLNSLDTPKKTRMIFAAIGMMIRMSNSERRARGRSCIISGSWFKGA